ncbi:MAG: hypothetical protein AAFV53_21550 [Myxococcota bacterium]
MSILHRIRWSRVSLAAAAVGALFFGAELLDEPDAQRPGPGLKLLTNQVWIDHLPRSERDMINQLIFIDKHGQRPGFFVRASVWRQFIERGRWTVGQGQEGLQVHFPQNDRRLKMKWRAYECKGKAPEPFELCLDLTIMGRTLKMYSTKEWRVEDIDQVEDLALPIDPDAAAGDDLAPLLIP